jgi:ribosomal protein L40E
LKEIIEILSKIVTDFEIKILEDAQKFKAVFTDYSKGKFRGERDLLIKIIEIGSYNVIMNSGDISVSNKVLSKKLHDEYLFDEKACSYILDIYSAILKSDIKNIKAKEASNNDISKENKKCKKCGATVNKQFIFCPYCGTKEFEQPNLIKKKIVDKVQRNKDIWICGNCNTSNNITIDFCEKCGKEFWPE